MSKIRTLFGAALIAGAATIVTQSKDVEPLVEETLNNFERNFRNSTQIGAQETGYIAFGSAALMALMGIGAIASSARRKILDDQKLHPDVEDKLREIIQDNDADTAKALKRIVKGLSQVDERLAGELSVDISALEKASSKMGSVEGASQRVLEILEKIENSANTHIALNTPDGALDRLSIAKINYTEAKNRLSKVAKSAMSDGNARTSWYPEHFNDILGKAATLDMLVLNPNNDVDKVTEAAERLSTTVSQHSDTIITQIINKGNTPGYSRPHLVAVSDASTNLILTANEYVAAQKNLVISQQKTAEQQNQTMPQLTSVNDGDDIFKVKAEGVIANEDGMIEVPGYGAIPANPAPQFD